MSIGLTGTRRGARQIVDELGGVWWGTMNSGAGKDDWADCADRKTATFSNTKERIWGGS